MIFIIIEQDNSKTAVFLIFGEKKSFHAILMSLKIIVIDNKDKYYGWAIMC